MTRMRIGSLAAALLSGVLGISGCGNGDDGERDAVAPPPTPAPVPLIPGTYNVRVDGPERYVRVDRMGQPVVGTVLLSRAPGSRPNGDNQRDALNRADPADDTGFVPEMLATLKTLLQQLNPALAAAGVTPCSQGAGSTIDIDKCVLQVAPVIVPDVITFDLDRPTSWPNGRRFDDPVVDRILALALIDLDIYDIDLLRTLPVNPLGNEANGNDQSPGTFPYLRPAFPEPPTPPPAPN
jgi:hypothetical protein